MYTAHVAARFLNVSKRVFPQKTQHLPKTNDRQRIKCFLCVIRNYGVFMPFQAPVIRIHSDGNQRVWAQPKHAKDTLFCAPYIVDDKSGSELSVLV